ncbi:unnamed protein product [Dicrocoelium dendriticum]|nr:unnamed protein product [Dicrocoelium dendriticum]
MSHRESSSVKSTDLMDHEWAMIKQEIGHFDPLHTGYIPRKQLGNVLRQLKLIPTDAEVEQIGNHLDVHKTGSIKIEHIYPVVRTLWPKNHMQLENQLWDAFMFFDKEMKGKITQQELRKILLTYGLEPLPEKEVKRIIYEFTDPKDGMIEYGAIIRAWMK